MINAVVKRRVMTDILTEKQETAYMIIMGLLENNVIIIKVVQGLYST